MRHKIIFGWVALSILFLMLVFPLSDILPQNHSSGIPDIPAEQTAEETFGELPVLFIENQGQLDETVEYYIKAPAQMLYFTKESIIFDLSRNNHAEATSGADRQAERLVFSLDFLGANSQPTIEGRGKDSTSVNYLVGSDPEKWHTNIYTCREVVYHDIYPAVDLRLRGKGSALEYDFVVKPGARLEDITLAYNGIDSLTMENDELVVGTAFGYIKQGRPYIYQQIGDEVVEVAGGFRHSSDKAYGFYVAAYDNHYPLIIDPTLTYSTYLGGSGEDWVDGIAVDAAGCAYITGHTNSIDFPTQNPYQGTFVGGSWDAFVAKLDTTKSGAASLVYSTYLGGSGYDQGNSIAVDSAGCAYVTGQTDSSDFPTNNPYGYNSVAFVAKLSAAGNSLIYSTFLGSTCGANGRGIAVDAAGCAYVTGNTGCIGCTGCDFPIQNPYQGSYAGNRDAFVTKLAAGGTLIYSTFLGGSGDDTGGGIAVDPAGCAYVTGYTLSIDFPTQNPYQGTSGGDADAFVAKLSAAGNTLVYSTYLGGNDQDMGSGIAADAAGYAYVTLVMLSNNFPTQNAFQGTYGGCRDAFVAKLDTTKSGADSLIYSTYLGGVGQDWGVGIAVDAVGCAYVTGETNNSVNFPIWNPYQVQEAGSGDAFVAKLDTTKSGDASLVYSTYLGGSGTEWVRGIAVDTAGSAYVIGNTNSSDLPTQNPCQGTFAGGPWDVFLAKLVETASTATASVNTATGSGTATFTTSSGSITGLTATSVLGTTCGIPPMISFPHGIFSFNITGITPGSTVTITITFPSAPGTQYWKCTPSGWLQIPVVSISGNVMTIQLTDGGIGDTDGAANGTIVDPGGPALSRQLIPWWLIILILLLLILIAIVIWLMRFRRPAWWPHFKKPK